MTKEIEPTTDARAPHRRLLPRDARPHGADVEIGVLTAPETAAALGVVVRGMRDNPLHIAALGTDPAQRERKLGVLMSVAFAAKDFSHTLVARRADGAIVGVCGMLPPGACVPRRSEQIRLMPRLLALGPRSLGRVVSWVGTWATHDPATRHWHLGPLAVDRQLQGQGIGSTLLRVCCAQLDAAGEDAYLETDKAINVTLYQRYGFTVIAEHPVLGVPNWFMLRHAQ